MLICAKNCSSEFFSQPEWRVERERVTMLLCVCVFGTTMTVMWKWSRYLSSLTTWLAMLCPKMRWVRSRLSSVFMFRSVTCHSLMFSDWKYVCLSSCSEERHPSSVSLTDRKTPSCHSFYHSQNTERYSRHSHLTVRRVQEQRNIKSHIIYLSFFFVRSFWVAATFWNRC